MPFPKVDNFLFMVSGSGVPDSVGWREDGEGSVAVWRPALGLEREDPPPRADGRVAGLRRVHGHGGVRHAREPHRATHTSAEFRRRRSGCTSLVPPLWSSPCSRRCGHPEVENETIPSKVNTCDIHSKSGCGWLGGIANTRSRNLLSGFTFSLYCTSSGSPKSHASRVLSSNNTHTAHVSLGSPPLLHAATAGRPVPLSSCCCSAGCALIAGSPPSARPAASPTTWRHRRASRSPRCPLCPPPRDRWSARPPWLG